MIESSQNIAAVGIIGCFRQLGRLARAVPLLLLSAFTTPASATTILSMDIDQLARDAEFIFEGEVINLESRSDSNSGIINTYVTFAVVDVIKGDYDADDIELKFAGGMVDGQIVEVSGLNIPKLGEQGIYFVESTSRDLLNPLLGWSQGHFVIVEQLGQRRITTADARPVVQVQPVSAIPPAIKKPQRLIEGNGEVASGVMTETSAIRMEEALTVNEFKTRILNLIEN